MFYFNNLPNKAIANKLDHKSIIKIAVVLPLTQEYASYGKELLFATNYAKQQLNNHIPQELMIELIPFDDQNDPIVASNIAYKIVKDPAIQIVIGHANPTINIMTSKIYAANKILHLIPNASNLDLNNFDLALTFKMSGDRDMQANAISAFLAKKFKKIAILHNQEDPHKKLAMIVAENLATTNANIAVYQNVESATFTDRKKIKKILNKLKKLDIDIIFFTGNPKELAYLIKNLHINNLKIPCITSDHIATDHFISLLGSPNIAAGLMMSFPNLNLNESEPINFKGQALLWYHAMQVAYATIVNSYQSANINHSIMLPPISGTTMANWLHHNTVMTSLGPKAWDTNGNCINNKFQIYLWDEHGNYWAFK